MEIENYYVLNSDCNNLFITYHYIGTNDKTQKINLVSSIQNENVLTLNDYINFYGTWTLGEIDTDIFFIDKDNKYYNLELEKINLNMTRLTKFKTAFKFWIIYGDKENMYFYNINNKSIYKMITTQYTPNSISPFNGDPVISKDIDRLIKKFKVKNIIETGTSGGATSKYLAAYYPKLKIYTSEIHEPTYLCAKSNFSNTTLPEDNYYTKKISQPVSNITALLGSSDKVLKDLLPTLSGTSLFYLDAHWNDYWPLHDELIVISENFKNDCIIVIDDFQVPNRPFGYDCYKTEACSLDYIKPIMDKYFDKYVFYYNDKHGRIPWGARGKIYIIPQALMTKFNVAESTFYNMINNIPYSNL
jgi:hypothetical protein